MIGIVTFLSFFLVAVHARGDDPYIFPKFGVICPGQNETGNSFCADGAGPTFLTCIQYHKERDDANQLLEPGRCLCAEYPLEWFSEDRNETLILETHLEWEGLNSTCVIQQNMPCSLNQTEVDLQFYPRCVRNAACLGSDLLDKEVQEFFGICTASANSLYPFGFVFLLPALTNMLRL